MEVILLHFIESNTFKRHTQESLLGHHRNKTVVQMAFSRQQCFISLDFMIFLIWLPNSVSSLKKKK